MPVNVSAKTPNQRQEYLSVMGIDSWKPHVQLPGALQSPIYVRTVPLPIAKEALQTPTNSPAGAVETRNAAKIPRRTAANILNETPVQARAPAPVQQNTVPAPARQAKAQATLTDAPLSLLLLECPGHCLIIDDAHRSREQQALLQNLMFALSAEPPANYRITPFDWASIPPQGGAPEDVLRGIVDRAVNQHAISTIMLMGESSLKLFECGAGTVGVVKTPAWLSGSAQLVATHSSKDLLGEPALKAETWAHIQAALNSTAS
ncbi:MAG: hypothetical protein AB8B48_10070 [Pseudomonadales bacterium]